MNLVFGVLYGLMDYSRTLLFGATVLAALACGASWALRTRRVTPFSFIGRFARERVDPALRSIERPVLNAGGSSSSVPWWGLAAFVVLGILAQQLLGYVVGILAVTVSAASAGPRGVLRAAAQLTFAVLQLALMIRVLASWFGSLGNVRWLRWTYSITEPLLGPLRAVLPALGPFDISPLVLFYLLRFVGGFVVQSL